MNQTNTPPKKDGSAETLRSSGWFARLFKRKPKPEPKMPAWLDDWNKVRAEYPIGRPFQYLGRSMLVAQYDYEWIGIYIPPMPRMICEYADNGGRLRNWAFYPHMSALLLANEKAQTRSP